MMYPVDYTTLRVVAHLKLLLTLRHYQRNIGSAVGTALLMLAALGLAAVGGAALFTYCHLEGAPARDAAFLWAAWIVTLVWLLAPLMQFDAQRNIDLNGLRLLPISGSSFTGAVLIDGAFSPLGMVMLPALAALCASFTLKLSELPWVLLSLLLVSTAMLGLGQAVYLWANRILTSRRFADISIIVGVLIFALLQTANLLVHQSERIALPQWLTDVVGFAGTVFSPAIHWLFPGLAAGAVEQLGAGNLAGAILRMIMLAVQAVIAVFLAGLAARQFYEGELESGGSAPQAKPTARPGVAAGLLRAELGTLFHRERVYLIRDPMLKMLLIQSLIGAVYVIAMILLVTLPGGAMMEEVAEYRHFWLFGLALMLSFMESGVLFNKFGYEGFLAVHTLLSPVDRRSLLAAKSIFYLSHFASVNLILVLGAALALRAPLIYTVAAAVMVCVNTAVVDLIGHFVSIYFPFTYRRRGRRMRAVLAQPGCGYALLYSLVYQLSNAAVLPLSAAIVLGVVFGGTGGLLLGSLAGVLSVIAAYKLGLPYAASLMVRREPEMVAVLCRSAE
jgi:hypothetical protein